MNPVVIGAMLTATATTSAAIIMAFANYKSSKHMNQIYQSIQTPEGKPEVGEMVTELMKEIYRQSAELDEIHDKLDNHLLHHEENKSWKK